MLKTYLAIIVLMYANFAFLYANCMQKHKGHEKASIRFSLFGFAPA